MNKETRIKVIAGSIFGLLAILGITLLPIWGSDNEVSDDDFNTVPKLSYDDAFSLDDMTSFENDDYKISDKSEEPTTNVDNLMNRINKAQSQTAVTEDDIYENENEQSTLTIQETIRALEAQRRALSNSSNNNNNSQYQNSSNNQIPVKTKKPELTEEEKYLAYIKRLEAEEQNTLENVNVSRNSVSKSQSIEAIVYEDQFVLPGDRLEMVLTKDVKVRGKFYKRGTPIFGMVSIGENRLLLDIQNIQGVPYNIVAHDPQDYREGLYSTRAGELWREYKKAQEEKLNDEASTEIAKNTKSRLIGSAFRDLANFFKNKKINRDRKIRLLNDDKVLLKIK